MDKIKDLHDEIIEKVKEYYHLVHETKQNETFVPGKSKVNYAGRVFDENEMANLADSALEFWLTYGKYSKAFEEKLAKFLNVKYALLVNSGSSANLLAFATLTSPLLKERQVKRGDEVITVACGFPTTIAPIIQYGAVPVFVDVERNSANINCDALAKAITNKTKAVMLAHTLGNPFDIARVKQLCEQHNLWLIEDNCDALASEFDGKFTGTFGDIGTSSFYPPHHLTMGEGGAVYTNNPLLKKIALSIRDWGRDCWCESGKDNTCNCRFTMQFGKLPLGYDHKYVYSHFGYNLKATDMQAAIGCAQLDKLPKFTSKRRENFSYLYEKLADLKELQFFEKCSQSNPSWFGFLMTCQENAPFTRNDFAMHLEKNLIQTRNLFAGNILKHPCFDSLKEGIDYKVVGSLEETDYIMNNSLWIGLYPGMGKDRLDYMIQVIRDYVLSFRK